MRVYVRGVALWGPGLEGWEASRPVLAGEANHVARESPPPAPAILPPTERRRAGLAVRLALNVAQGASAMAGLPAASLRNVFASSNGDGAVIHAILETLATGDGLVSPTQFHNSVHNAAVGYWTIGAGSAQAATCLGCHDDTFPAALLKAAAEARVEGEPVLLCVYDVPMPPPLAAARPTAGGFAAAFILAPEPSTGALAAVDLDYDPASSSSSHEPDQPSLAALIRTNPAARSLPLLQALARERPAELALAYLEGQLRLRVEQCSDPSGSPR
jgi:hypothetical protein